MFVQEITDDSRRTGNEEVKEVETKIYSLAGLKEYGIRKLHQDRLAQQLIKQECNDEITLMNT